MIKTNIFSSDITQNVLCDDFLVAFYTIKTTKNILLADTRY